MVQSGELAISFLSRSFHSDENKCKSAGASYLADVHGVLLQSEMRHYFAYLSNSQGKPTNTTRPV